MSTEPTQLWFKQLELGPMQNYVYLIGDPTTRQAAVIDAAWDIDAIVGEAEADGETMRRGDDRLPIDGAGEQVGGVRAPALGTAVLFQIFLAAQLALMNVRTAGEGAAGAVKNCHVRLLVNVELMQDGGEPHDHKVVEGVQLLRAVEGDRGDAL